MASAPPGSATFPRFTAFIVFATFTVFAVLTVFAVFAVFAAAGFRVDGADGDADGRDADVGKAISWRARRAAGWGTGRDEAG
jgi:hypothetical protein